MVTKPDLSQDELLNALPAVVRMRAQYILSHCLLPASTDQSHTPVIIDSGCGNGIMTFIMAYYAPHIRFVGIDRNPQAIDRAHKKYGALSNISFITADIANLPFAEETADAVICSRMLGPLYTRLGFDMQECARAFAHQITCLKPGGAFLMYDMMAKSDGDYVLMEFPIARKTRKTGQPPEKIKESDRAIANLIWFHDHAQPRQADGCQGFFLEELPQKLPFTRLFRMPAKWAYEFIIRHEIFGDTFRKNVGLELTCMNEHEVCELMPRIGCRVDYTAPWVNPYIVDNYYKPCFKLYTDAYKPAPYPETGHIFVSHKFDGQRMVKIKERKQAKDMPEKLSIHAIQDLDNGEVHDLVSVDDRRVDIIPYQLQTSADGETIDTIHVYLQGHAAKAIANSVPRAGHNLDGREWSGYMPSAVSTSGRIMDDVQERGDKDRYALIREYTGLRCDLSFQFEDGPSGYPAPDMVEMRIDTHYVQIHDTGQSPKTGIVAYNLDDVLRAITVGLIPDAWLEVQLTHLKLKLQGQRHGWMHVDLPIGNEAPPPDRIVRVEDIMAQVEADNAKAQEEALAETGDQRYRDTRGGTGQLKALRSVFVDEGLGDHRLSGIRAREVEFAVPTGKSVNKAAVLPLTRDLDGNAMAGFDLDHMPVPYRMGQTEKMVNLPTYTLPETVQTIDDAKAYLAKKYDTDIEKVVQMGPSFFSCIDYTPERIYPFAIARQGGWGKLWDKFYAPIQDLWMFDETDFKWSFLYSWGFAVISLSYQGGYGASYQSRMDENQRKFSTQAPKKEAAPVSSIKQWTSGKNRNDNTQTNKPSGRKHAI